MKKNKQIGIFMDHSNAILVVFINDEIVQKNVVSESTHQVKEDSLLKGEKHMHVKEQHQQSRYYKTLSETIKNYQEVVLFGPTAAKDELFNLMKGDHQFENIKIEVKHTDKMSENEMHDFVREYFK